MKNKIAIVDIETTGFLDNGGLILEVGIVELDLKTGETKMLYDELVREETYNHTHKTSWIFENSDLTHNEICCASPLDKARIQEIFNKYPVTAYNKKFDFDFLRSRGVNTIIELDCPMIILTDICKIPHPNGYGWKWPKVEESWDFLFGQTGYIEKHRGLDDAHHEAKIIHELHKRGEFHNN